MRAVEVHEQTQQKLDIIRQYAAAYVNIIANYPGRGFNNRLVYLVDTCAGAGLHRSGLHPDGVVLGTALIAAAVAEQAQARRPGLSVPVRLIEINREWCGRLEARLARFRARGVDVKVLPGDLVDRIPDVVAEVTEAGRQVRSLWIIDPDGFVEIPHAALDPLTRPARGPELVINLDMSGIWRTGVASSHETAVELLAQLDQQKQEALNRTFGTGNWRAALDIQSRAAAQDALAAIYGETLRHIGTTPGFEEVTHYRLRSSLGQIRYFIHATHAETAKRTFGRIVDATNRPEYLSRALNQQARGVEAVELWRLFAGTELPFEAMLGARPLNRQQLATVLRHAAGEGYGSFEPETKAMTWFVEREPPLTLGF